MTGGNLRRQELADWLSGVPVVPGDEAVAATWGKLSAAGRKAGRPQPVNDMWIAACCLTHDLPLATLNLKDYEYFRDKHDLRILGEGQPGPGSRRRSLFPSGCPVSDGSG
ncbi:hypothetical protein DMH02_012920 [Streptomyces sp. WAC 00631]|uniref:PIN domain-containing protein n=1 Tax=unclassified Streptomyces TaxID=2593676 RepID=UPI001C8CACF1|nr:MULTISPECIES: PIN domain-containing protein [unclassified Streptomyces]MCC5034103.1 hypothetical protein [Streptomyces sp. WAC 00631]MCC9742512.1 hypothetical protein [Streptomyces sp. MNU89]